MFFIPDINLQKIGPGVKEAWSLYISQKKQKTNLGIFKLRDIWLDGKTRKRNPLSGYDSKIK